MIRIVTRRRLTLADQGCRSQWLDSEIQQYSGHASKHTHRHTETDTGKQTDGQTWQWNTMILN